VILVGFTDAQGTNKANVTLGKQRAESIATLMHQRGVTLDEVASFGDALPVAPNNTPSARSRNRRVEVWIR